MLHFVETEQFLKWFKSLRDKDGKIRMAGRIARLKDGNAGDVKAVGAGVSELRFHFGPGYRIYFARYGNT